MKEQDYREINRIVMSDTKYTYENTPELCAQINDSIKRQYIVTDDVNECSSKKASSITQYIISGKRSLEAAKEYKNKKVAVLNFANNHSVGGDPFSAGAQEESICRCSTLYPCLCALKDDFYIKHQRMFDNKEIGYMGNDDLIYTPDVVVFKTDERTPVIFPQMMPTEEWYKVDIITCAAPEVRNMNSIPQDYEELITRRLKRALDVAAKENVEVLILGKWGCGAFKNPPKIVASVFKSLLKNYNFEIVEFALASNDNLDNDEFAQVCSAMINNNSMPKKDSILSDEEIKNEILSLLKSTNRKNIDRVTEFLVDGGFFEAAASKNQHNNFKGGLARHSYEVYERAMELNKQKEYSLPSDSIILCALLHDICKIDQYPIKNGVVCRIEEKIKKGHGRRSMFILKRGCQLPLNYDEEMAIWWHMGEHEGSEKRYPSDYQESLSIPLCKLIQQADGFAAHNPKKK